MEQPTVDVFDIFLQFDITTFSTFQISKSISISLSTLQFVALSILHTSIYLKIRKNSRIVNRNKRPGKGKDAFVGRNLALPAFLFLCGAGLLESLNAVELLGVFLGSNKFSIKLRLQLCQYQVRLELQVGFTIILQRKRYITEVQLRGNLDPCQVQIG